MRKILFNDKYGLTKAVLEGRKTMTRREIAEKNIEEITTSDGVTHHVDNRVGSYHEYTDHDGRVWLAWSPFKVGDVVAVAQSYEKIGLDSMRLEPMFLPIATIIPEVSSQPLLGWHKVPLKYHKGWTNKMFVGSELIPHHIRITNIKVERLQDISDDDCLKEGIRLYTQGVPQCTTQVVGSNIDFIPPYGFDDYQHKTFRNFDTPREAFSDLIDKVSGKGIWNRNPFVFAYTFELVD